MTRLDRVCGVALLGVATLGCDAQGSRSAEAPARAKAAATSAVQARAPAATRSAPEPTRAVDPRALAAFSPEDRDRVARSVVPVLAPVSRALEPRTFVASREFYTLTATATGATVTIQGTRATRDHGDLGARGATRSVRGEPARVTVNEGIRSAAWREGGASYSVDVECASAGDVRCDGDAFVLGVAESLALAGGGGP